MPYSPTEYPVHGRPNWLPMSGLRWLSAVSLRARRMPSRFALWARTATRTGATRSRLCAHKRDPSSIGGGAGRTPPDFFRKSKEVPMDTYAEILRTLGHIEGGLACSQPECGGI